MKLKDYMAECNSVVAIGARASYLFIGDREEFHRDLGKLNKAQKDKIYNRVVRAMQAKDEEKWQIAIDQFNNYVPLEEREIKEVFASFTDRDVNIIIEGDELGTVCTRNEYSGITTEEDVDKDFVMQNYRDLANTIVSDVMADLIIHWRYQDRTKEHKERFRKLQKWMLTKECSILAQTDGKSLMESAIRIEQKENERRKKFYEVVCKYHPMDAKDYFEKLYEYDSSHGKCIKAPKYFSGGEQVGIPGKWRASVVCAMAVTNDRKAVKSALEEVTKKV